MFTCPNINSRINHRILRMHLRQVVARRPSVSVRPLAGPRVARKSPLLEVVFWILPSLTQHMTASTTSGPKRPPITRTVRARKTPSSWTQTDMFTSSTSTVETTRSCTLNLTDRCGTRLKLTPVRAITAGTPTWSSMTTMNST